MSFFPTYFNLNHKKILLVGGGFIALEKLEKLVDFTKDISIITKEISSDFADFALAHDITITQRAYEVGDILGYDIVIVATDTVTYIKKFMKRVEVHVS